MQRYFTSGACVACTLKHGSDWYREHREITNARSRAWYRANRAIADARRAAARRAQRAIAAAAPAKRSAPVRKTYIGTACKFGHTRRYRKSGNCVECMLARTSAWKIARRAAAGPAPVRSAGPARYHNDIALVPAPCDGCALAIQCRAARIACRAFELFIEGSPARVWSAAPRAPTRGTFFRSMVPQAAQPKHSPLAAYG
jgi:hypothetical protein